MKLFRKSHVAKNVTPTHTPYTHCDVQANTNFGTFIQVFSCIEFFSIFYFTIFTLNLNIYLCCKENKLLRLPYHPQFYWVNMNYFLTTQPWLCRRLSNYSLLVLLSPKSGTEILLEKLSLDVEKTTEVWPTYRCVRSDWTIFS